MNTEVVVGAVGNTLKFAPFRVLETKAVFQVNGALGVMRKLFLRVLVLAQVFLGDTQADVPRLAVVDPVLVPLFISSGLTEELKFHLLKFAGTEDEVTGGNFVAERLTDLADAEGRLLTCRGHDIGEVDEDSLCGFGAQVVQAGLVINGTKEGLEQARECLGFGPLTTNTTVGASYVFQ